MWPNGCCWLKHHVTLSYVPYHCAADVRYAPRPTSCTHRPCSQAEHRCTRGISPRPMGNGDMQGVKRMHLWHHQLVIDLCIITFLYTKRNKHQWKREANIGLDEKLHRHLNFHDSINTSMIPSLMGSAEKTQTFHPFPSRIVFEGPISKAERIKMPKLLGFLENYLGVFPNFSTPKKAIGKPIKRGKLWDT